MATKIRKTTSTKQQIRFKRKLRIRSTLQGTAERPRLAVFRSNRHIYVQLINDVLGSTLCSASSQDEGLKGKVDGSVDGAKAVGESLAKKALAKGISAVVFDRSGYLYHGRVKAIADAARSAGLQF